MLPVLGPSTLRDTAALPVDWKGDLIWRMPRGDERTGLYALRAVDRRSNLLRAGDVLDQASLDKYSFTRDAHLQRRRAEIFDTPATEDDSAGKEPKADGHDGEGEESAGHRLDSNETAHLGRWAVSQSDKGEQALHNRERFYLASLRTR